MIGSIGSGYAYIALMRKSKNLGNKKDCPVDDLSMDFVASIEDLPEQFDKMITYMIDTLDHFKEFEEEPWTVFVTTRSGNQIDFETLLEHSVVHILRHRRQIEKFVLKLQSN